MDQIQKEQKIKITMLPNNHSLVISIAAELMDQILRITTSQSIAEGFQERI